MDGSADRMRRALIWSWTGAVIIFMYLPALSLFLASSTSSRYFGFPITKWGFVWWKTFESRRRCISFSGRRWRLRSA